MNRHKRLIRWLVVSAIGSLVLMVFGVNVTFAQGEAVTIADIASLQISIDSTWILLTAFLVFFMQAGFALLEAGMIRQTGVVNSLMENFMDACLGGLSFWAIGYGIAFGASQAGGLFGASNFFLSEAMQFTGGNVVWGEGISMFVLFVFQFAFCATAGTIATGGMAERTNFVGKIIYTLLVAAIIYPVVVHWVWGGGWLAQNGFIDFAGSTVVHMVGGVIALAGAIALGPRAGRKFGDPPRPHNLALATLGALILWFGWYGFNPGSALSMGNNGLVGLVTVNTTLAACAGALMAVFYSYSRTGKWDLPAALNGSLGGLVGITAGCAVFAPWASVVVGLVGGILVMLGVQLLERLKIDDAVGAVPVHGMCGAMGTLMIGLLAQPELVGRGGIGGLLLGGSGDLLLAQATGVFAVVIWTGITAAVMFAVIKAVGVLRIPEEAEVIGGIDVFEHGATVWPDVFPLSEDTPATGKSGATVAPAAGD